MFAAAAGTVALSRVESCVQPCKNFIFRLRMCILRLKMHILSLKMCISNLEIKKLPAWMELLRRERRVSFAGWRKFVSCEDGRMKNVAKFVGRIRKDRDRIWEREL